ncbi:beta-lactamase/transpeptidase-like protein [Dactylonectria estremocensis]|uniref:Beta-lactamase/transpeptidase-like protein n=1 Tax=Dactylonectria estremocensis TaxID=1079267 RepID=A0A9P9EVD4_9HYPO|nr:beta-lactamase/transpeptidase-like protein [Dactylonectria estremocensis]
MDRLNTILQEHIAQGGDTSNKLLGAAFIVVNSQGPIDFGIDSKPFQANSFTWIASLTKIVTTTSLMQIVERGLVGLDDNVRSLIPELVSMQILRGFEDDGKPILEDNTRPITLRNLLTHTLGLGYDIADPDLVRWSNYVGRTATNLDWSREGFNTPLKFAPGDGWYYGAAVDWAAQILEKLTGQPLSEYVQEHIFDPLGIQDSGFWPKKLPQTADRTVTYSFREGDTLNPGPPSVPREHEIESGGAGLFSTAHDFAVFLRGLLQGKLVEEQTLQAMFTPQLNEAQSAMLVAIAYTPGVHEALAPEFPAGLAINHGLGGVINVEDVPGKRRKGSLMWSGMCNSRWWIDRETGIASVLVVNVQPFGDAVVKSLYNELERAVYDSSGGSSGPLRM